MHVYFVRSVPLSYFKSMKVTSEERDIRKVIGDGGGGGGGGGVNGVVKNHVGNPTPLPLPIRNGRTSY